MSDDGAVESHGTPPPAPQISIKSAAPPDGWDRAQQVASIAASIAVPIIVLFVGTSINDTISQRESTTNLTISGNEISAQYVGIAAEILRQPVTEDNAALREWAIEIVNVSAPVPLSQEAQSEIRDGQPITADTAEGCRQKFSVPDGEREIRYIVISDSATPSLSSLTNVICNSEINASYHYAIGLDGTVSNFVSEEHIAWHAGSARYEGNSNLNAVTIGIGMVHIPSRDGQNSLNLEAQHPAVGPDYTDAQLAALRDLLAELTERYELNVDAILTQQDIAPDRRRTDLYGAGIAELREEVLGSR